MTNKRTIALHLNGMPYEQVVVLAQRVHDGLVANAGVYTSPVVSLVTQQAAIDALQAANIDCGVTGNRGGKLAHAVRDSAGEVVKAILKKLAAYCEIVTPNDVAMWGDVGFVTKQLREKAPAAGPPQNLHQVIKANVPTNGILLKWQKPLEVTRRRMIIYKLMRSETDNLADAKLVATVTKTSFTDIVEKAGVFYRYWVIPVNANGDGRASDICFAAAQLTHDV